MSRLLDFTPTEEDIIVSRVLISVHKAIDKNFPNAEPAPNRFAKTSFGSEEITITESKPMFGNNKTSLPNNESIEKLESLTVNKQDALIKKTIIFVMIVCLITVCIYYLTLST